MSGGGTQTTTQSTNTSLPSYIKPYMNDFLGKAQTAANQPFSAYTGQLVAPTSDATTQANNQITGIAAAGVPQGLTDAQHQLGGIAGYRPTSLPGANLSGYMSPYTQSVIDVQKQQATQDFQQQQAGRDSAAVQAGAFGGDRAAIVNAISQQNLNQNLQGIEASGLNTAYNNAVSAFQTDQSNLLQGNQLGINAATAEGNLAQNANSIALQNAAALSGVGTQQQQQQQNTLDSAYQQWQLQQGYPAQQAGLYSQLLAGTWQPQSTTSTTTPAPSLLSQIAGLAATGIGAYMGMK